MKNFLLKFVIVILQSPSIFYAQGCIDAGFCSLQNTNENDSLKLNSLIIGAGNGTGFEDINVFNSYLEYSRFVNENLSIQAKIVFLNADGGLGSNNCFGDLFFTSNYELPAKTNYRYSFLAGVKISLNNANTRNESGFSLPLDYQTSLGTYEFIFGINLQHKNHLEFSTALQIPIINSNENQFLSGTYLNSENFASTNNFKRKPDALLRFPYLYAIPNSKFSFKPNLLSIYHLGKDIYTNNNNPIKIEGSKGLTINGGVVTNYTFKNKSQIELITAIPLLVREIRPDGLTRS